MNRKGIADHAYEEQEPSNGGSYPLEPKTKAAAVGGGVGGALGLFLVWVLDQLFWNGDVPPDVPAPVSGLIWVVMPALVALVASYGARHVNRPSTTGRTG